MPVILDARGLCKTFGAVTAAAEVSAAIEQDSVVGLIGTNGAGKTTFLNIVTGYLKPDRGCGERAADAGEPAGDHVFHVHRPARRGAHVLDADLVVLDRRREPAERRV